MVVGRSVVLQALTLRTNERVHSAPGAAHSFVQGLLLANRVTGVGRLEPVDRRLGSANSSHTAIGIEMNKVFEKIREEFVALIPPTIFFFITLSLVAVVRMLMTRGTGLPVSSPIQVAIGALILGKAVLIADMLPVINRYPDKPLVYNIAWKTVIYFVAALVIHYLERLVDFWKETGGLLTGNEKLLAEIVWPHFWAIQIILVVLILNYCVIHELARIIGPTKLWEMFFGRPAGAAA